MERNHDSLITVVIPTLNEDKNIEAIIRKLRDLDYSRILVIDGNSQDRTVEIAKNLGVNVLLQNGKGKGDAIRQAFNYAQLGEWVIMMDADGSMSPEEIPSFLDHLKRGSDVVKGSRFMRGGFSEDMTFFRRIGNRAFVILVNGLFAAGYTDLCYGYAAFKKEAINRLLPDLTSRNFEIETEIFVKAKKKGLRISEVPSIERKRTHGKSNLNGFVDGFKILRAIFHEAF